MNNLILYLVLFHITLVALYDFWVLGILLLICGSQMLAIAKKSHSNIILAMDAA
jgi:hypothetical protein